MTTPARTTTNDAEIHKAVRAAYAGRAGDPGCCGAGDVATAAHKMGYSKDDVDAVPDGANAGRGGIDNVEFRGGWLATGSTAPGCEVYSPIGGYSPYCGRSSWISSHTAL